MSYCHLTSSTIKFANGFGPQPTAVILNRVNNGQCLEYCGTTCDAPSNIWVVPHSELAEISWDDMNSTTYILRWRPAGTTTWTTVTGLLTNSYELTGLTFGVSYELQISNVCAGAGSAWSHTSVFTTQPVCIDIYEPNNNTGQAALLDLPAAINAVITAPPDNWDFFQFILTEPTDVEIELSELPGNYLLNIIPNGQLAVFPQQNNPGTESEYIYLHNLDPAVNWYLSVGPSLGIPTFLNECYLLSITPHPVACPGELEPNNFPSTSTPLGFPGNKQGIISYPGDKDHFSFEITEPTDVTVTLSGPSTDHRLELRTLFDVLAFSDIPGSADEQVQMDALAPGVYHIGVSAGAGLVSDQCYTVQVSDGSDIITAVAEENKATKLHLYPNPSNDWVHWSTGNPADGQRLTIQDAIGRMVLEWTAPLPLVLDVSHLANGRYMVLLQSRNTVAGSPLVISR